jgi:hypothetical protein
MSIWRRGEPLHERLAREGGLEQGEPPPHDTTPRWGGPGIHGVPRPRQWDATVVVEAPALGGDEATFVALPDGTLLVEEGGDDVEPLADALEGQLPAPYRAHAIHRDERRWAVAARRIEVVELPPDVGGEELELTASEGERSLRVDGMPSFGNVPALERLGEARGDSYVVHAQRLDGLLWEVHVAPL